MKVKNYRLLTVLLAVMMFVMVGVPVQAAADKAVTKDGLTAQITTDKDAYTSEEAVNAVIRIENNTESDVSIKAAFNLSDTALIMAGNKTYETVIKAGEQWTTPEGVTTSAASLRGAGALTSGVALKVALWSVAGVVLAAVIVVAFLVAKKNKTKAAMLFLGLTMAGLLAVVAVPAQAASKEGKMTVSCSVMVDDAEKEISATINYTILDEKSTTESHVQETEQTSETPAVDGEKKVAGVLKTLSVALDSEDASDTLNGRVGDVKKIIIKAFDAYGDEVELTSKAQYAFKSGDELVAKVNKEEGKNELAFMSLGSTALKVTVRQDGKTVSKEFSVVCEGVAPDANVCTVNFTDKDGKIIPEMETKVVAGGAVRIPSGDAGGLDLKNMTASVFGGWYKFVNDKPVGNLLNADDEVTIKANTVFKGIYADAKVVYYGDGSDTKSANYEGTTSALESVTDPINADSDNKVFKISNTEKQVTGAMTYQFDSSVEAIVVEFKVATAKDEKDRIKAYVALGSASKAFWIGSTAGEWQNVKVVINKAGNKWIANSFVYDETTNSYVAVEKYKNKTLAAGSNMLHIGAQVRADKPVFYDDIVIYTVPSGGFALDDSYYPVSFADHTGQILTGSTYRILPDEEGNLVLPKAPNVKDIVDEKGGTIVGYDSFAYWTNDKHVYDAGMTMKVTDEKDVYQAIYNATTYKLLNYFECDTVSGLKFAKPTNGVVVTPEDDPISGSGISDDPANKVFRMKMNYTGSGSAAMIIPVDTTYDTFVVEMDIIPNALSFVALDEMKNEKLMWSKKGATNWMNVKVVMTKNAKGNKWITRSYIYDDEKCAYVLDKTLELGVKDSHNILIGGSSVSATKNVYFDNIKAYTPIVPMNTVTLMDHNGNILSGYPKDVITGKNTEMPNGPALVSGNVDTVNNTVATKVFKGWQPVDESGNPSGSMVAAGSAVQVNADLYYKAVYADGTGNLLRYTDGTDISKFFVKDASVGTATGGVTDTKNAENKVVKLERTEAAAGTIRWQTATPVDANAFTVEFKTMVPDMSKGSLAVCINDSTSYMLFQTSSSSNVVAGEWVKVRLDVAKGSDGKWTSTTYTASDESDVYTLNSAKEIKDMPDVTMIGFRTTLISSSLYLDDIKIYVPNHTISFLDENGVELANLKTSIADSESLTFPNAPVKAPEGATVYYFLGWFKTDVAGNIADNNAYQVGSTFENISETTTFIAQYTSKPPVTISFVDGAGNPLDELETVAAEGFKVIMPNTLTMESVLNATAGTLTKYKLVWTNVADTNDVVEGDGELTATVDATYKAGFVPVVHTLFAYKDGTEDVGLVGSGNVEKYADFADSTNTVYKISTTGTNKLVSTTVDISNAAANANALIVEFKIKSNYANRLLFAGFGNGTSIMWSDNAKTEWMDVKIELTKDVSGANWLTNSYVYDAAKGEYVAAVDYADKSFAVSNTLLHIGSQVTTINGVGRNAYIDDIKVYSADGTEGDVITPTPAPTPVPTATPAPGTTPAPTAAPEANTQVLLDTDCADETFSDVTYSGTPEYYVFGTGRTTYLLNSTADYIKVDIPDNATVVNAEFQFVNGISKTTAAVCLNSITNPNLMYLCNAMYGAGVKINIVMEKGDGVWNTKYSVNDGEYQPYATNGGVITSAGDDAILFGCGANRDTYYDYIKVTATCGESPAPTATPEPTATPVPSAPAEPKVTTYTATDILSLPANKILSSSAKSGFYETTSLVASSAFGVSSGDKVAFASAVAQDNGDTTYNQNVAFLHDVSENATGVVVEVIALGWKFSPAIGVGADLNFEVLGAKDQNGITKTVATMVKGDNGWTVSYHVNDKNDATLIDTTPLDGTVSSISTVAVGGSSINSTATGIKRGVYISEVKITETFD